MNPQDCRHPLRGDGDDIGCALHALTIVGGLGRLELRRGQRDQSRDRFRMVVAEQTHEGTGEVFELFYQLVCHRMPTVPSDCGDKDRSSQQLDIQPLL
ncbi:hypothetical protein [Streptomyces phaeochromogenes]|uniref:hypothetical protein n=1 Tax=Streptomyces phaeochromogenes TaxID=1923 RepID=UPI0027D7760A|nr:hypothetical protein [Streptomyces phaeochromogenes]